MPEKNEVWSSWYLSLFDDLSLGISDGVGYKDTMDKEDVIKLYKAMKGLIESSGEKPKVTIENIRVLAGWIMQAAISTGDVDVDMISDVLAGSLPKIGIEVSE